MTDLLRSIPEPSQVEQILDLTNSIWHQIRLRVCRVRLERPALKLAGLRCSATMWQSWAIGQISVNKLRRVSRLSHRRELKQKYNIGFDPSAFNRSW